MYFHVGEAQSYLLSEDADGGVFQLVRETNPTA
jgi:carbonic anhydrase